MGGESVKVSSSVMDRSGILLGVLIMGDGDADADREDGVKAWLPLRRASSSCITLTGSLNSARFYRLRRWLTIFW